MLEFIMGNDAKSLGLYGEKSTNIKLEGVKELLDKQKIPELTKKFILGCLQEKVEERFSFKQMM